MKTSDYIANFLVDHGAKHIFTISGAGDVHILDSVAHNSNLTFVCPHHEQAGVMAAITYTRISGRPGIMITTTGPGAVNAITGVLSAWADSIPIVVISGQERTTYANLQNPLRMWGVQGTNFPEIVRTITKYSVTVPDPGSIRYHLEKAFHLAYDGRPGPVWVDIPMDVQAATIDPNTLKGYTPEKSPEPDLTPTIATVIEWLHKAERPVCLIGHGIRLAGAQSLVAELVQKVPIPYLTSWNGADLLANEHPLHFGHAGTYGQRCANFVIQNCDFLLTIGTRLAIPQVGYDFSEFARAAKKVMVDIDPTELNKFGEGIDLKIKTDAGRFLAQFLRQLGGTVVETPKAWVERCRTWKRTYPLFDPSIHEEKPGTINSFHFINHLSSYFRPDEIIITDMGTSLTCTHQAIVLRDRQRLATSTGLGEMGFGLPGAIGASIASNKQRVILIVGDGSLMMNLQELQTVVHHKLPIKMFLYNNGSYLTIKHTQTGLFGRIAASDPATGVTCPDYMKVIPAFGIPAFRVSEWKDVDAAIARVLNADGPMVCELIMDPIQPLVPKLSFSVQDDGSMVSPPIEDLFPFLPRAVMKEEMIIGMHEKSKKVKDA
jgi:acetolactate synthase I/II/III large subunit